MIPQLVIEVGPQASLAAYVKQSVGALGSSQVYKYVPALQKQDTVKKSILHLVETLFLEGHCINANMLALMGLSALGSNFFPCYAGKYLSQDLQRSHKLQWDY